MWSFRSVAVVAGWRFWMKIARRVWLFGWLWKGLRGRVGARRGGWMLLVFSIGMSGKNWVG